MIPRILLAATLLMGTARISTLLAQPSPAVSATTIDAQDIPLAALPDLKSAKDPQSPKQIQKRIDTLFGATLRTWCDEAKIAFPPTCVLLRAFKLEKECELWAGNDNDPLALLKTLRICAVDDEPGPKLMIGDNKTPEGFYESYELYGSQYWWMWMKLGPRSVDEPGEAYCGSSFRLCINYPNSADLARSRRLATRGPGGDICIHGNCVTAGCISFKNRAFLAVYYCVTKHNAAKNGAVQVQIFPFRFSEENKKRYADAYAPMKAKELLAFWNNLEEGCQLFEKTHRPVRFSYRKDRYMFSK
jgi:murein L,D-transpeptidase YafK